MPILTKRNEYVIPITLKCNWNCSYCAMNNKYDNLVDTTHDITIQRINQLPEKCICTITGGEPGLVDIHLINEYISLLNNNHISLYLETNGLFIKKYPKLIYHFNEVLYHCSVDLNDTLIYFPYKNIRYLLVLTDLNISNLVSYLDKNYKNIKFDFIPATYPYLDDVHGPILSNKNKHLILSKYYKYMTDDSIHRFLTDKKFELIQWKFK